MQVEEHITVKQPNNPPERVAPTALTATASICKKQDAVLRAPTSSRL